MDETPAAGARGGGRSKVGLVAIALVGALLVAGVIVLAGRRSSPWQRSGPPITVSSWVPYWQTDSGFSSYSANVGVFGDVSMFAYHATAAQVVVPYDGVDVSAIERFRQTARANGRTISASIVDDTAAGQMATILADPQTRAAHVQAIVALATQNDFDGIDIDYEHFAFADGRDTWVTTRPNWVAFITELAHALHGVHKTLAVSVPYVLDGGQTDASGYWVYDPGAVGKVVDTVRIMAYDYSTSEPGPIAPLNWVRDVVTAMKQLVPARKLVLGIPVYGRDWAGVVTGTCPADQTPKTHAVSATTAAQTAAANGVVPQWATNSAERTYSYVETIAGPDAAGNPLTCTVARTVWYPDDRSVYERAWIAERSDLAGVALYPLGTDEPAMWPAIALARANTATWPVAAGSVTGD